jgi:hypothetical protein
MQALVLVVALRLLPLRKQRQHLAARVLDDAVHLDVVLVVAEGVLELLADALDAVEREGDDGDDGDGPPDVVVYDGEGQDAGEESEDLFLVDAGVYCWRRVRAGRGGGGLQMGDGHGCGADGLHAAVGVDQRVDLHRHLRRKRRVEPPAVHPSADVAFHQHAELQRQA